MMTTSVIIKVSTLVISFIIGLLLYLFIIPEHIDKRKSMDQLTTFLINFIVFVWIGKIIFKLPLFIQDPLAVLAYPSNSSAFYFAIITSCLWMYYRVRKRDMDIIEFLFSLISIYIFAGFIYEFINMIWHENPFSKYYLILLFILIIVYLVLLNKFSEIIISTFILIFLGVGQIYLSLRLPFVTMFGYMLSPWFSILLIGVGLILLIRDKRKKV